MVVQKHPEKAAPGEGIRSKSTFQHFRRRFGGIGPPIRTVAIRRLLNQLVGSGRNREILTGETPCAIISRATTRHEQRHRTTVVDLHRAPKLAAPTVLVVGEVVALSSSAAILHKEVLPSPSQDNEDLLPLALFQNASLAGPALKGR